MNSSRTPARARGARPVAAPAAAPTLRDRLDAVAPWVTLVARVVLAVVFAVAGWPKLLDAQGTLGSVRAFRLVPEAIAPAFAYALPALELALAALLLVGLITRIAAIGVGLLLVMFIFGIAMAWARGLSIECGCFGAGSGPVIDPVRGYVEDILRDLGLLVLTAWVVLRPPGRFALDSTLRLQPTA